MTDHFSPKWHRVLFVLKSPKGSMVVSIIKFSQDSENVSLAKIIPSGDITKCVWMYVPSKCRIFDNRRPLTNILLQIINLQVYNEHRTNIYTPSESLWTYQPVGIHVGVMYVIILHDKEQHICDPQNRQCIFLRTSIINITIEFVGHCLSKLFKLLHQCIVFSIIF